MTVEELYLKEKYRIEKLARHYARMFSSKAEDLFQEGALTVTEIYAKYGVLPDEELFKVSHRVINRKIYKYAQNEYRYKTCPELDSGTTSSLESDDTTKTNYS
jgi:hypothetical protein